MSDSYAQAGVDPRKIAVFKDLMGKICRSTASLSAKRGVEVHAGLAHSHGGVFRLGRGPWQCITLEGPGNLPWGAGMMYQLDDEQDNPLAAYHIVSGYTSVMMAANDCIAQAARPAICLDLVAAKNSDWFKSAEAADMARGIELGCIDCGMALVAGESPSMKYIINAKEPVVNAPDVAVAVMGVVQSDDQLITGERLGPGSQIVGFGSSGVHGNGWTLIFDKVQEKLKRGFAEVLPNGKRLGEELLVKTLCYVPLVEALLDAGIRPHALLPGTGDGVAKLASDKREFLYQIDRWPPFPFIFEFLHKVLGIPMSDMLTTFNMGIGYYAMLDASDVELTIAIAKRAGYTAMRLGEVANGKRGVNFHPLNLWLPPKN